MDPARLCQETITRDLIAEMCDWKPRRMSLAEYNLARGDKVHVGLNKPRKDGDDWNLAFPFKDSFVPAFECAFEIQNIGFRQKEGVNLVYTFLKNVADEDIEDLSKWLGDIDKAVAIRDCLALSFAMDYEREYGNPDNDQTETGALRASAKTYGGLRPTDTSMRAADNLASRLAGFIRDIRAYNYSQCVVAVPPSSLSKPFDLPTHLAKTVAAELQWADLSSAVRTVKERPQLKNLPVGEKLEALDGTVKVESEAVKGRVVTLIDDLYQSGVTMNYVAMKLQKAGARAILGLACEKTLRNDDNVQDE
ncbi:MAG TPA: hypothetical protein VM425_13255 [Myxococcota bacterium]|nr:hypothetical protein [Myxococcota bacterium]